MVPQKTKEKISYYYFDYPGMQTSTVNHFTVKTKGGGGGGGLDQYSRGGLGGGGVVATTKSGELALQNREQYLPPLLPISSIRGKKVSTFPSPPPLVKY